MRRIRIADHETRRLIAAVGILILVGAVAWIAEPEQRPRETAELPVVSAAAPRGEAAGAAIPESAAPPEFVTASAEPRAEADLPSSLAPEAAQSAPSEAEASAAGDASGGPQPPAIPTLRHTGTTIISQGELERGDTLTSAMIRAHVPSNVVQLVSVETSKAFDFRRAQPGQRFYLTQDLDGRVLDFRYHPSAIESIHLKLENGVYVVRREQSALVPKMSRIAGVVDSSLYGAVVDLGEQPQLANDFTNVFAWDVDFSRTVRHGDEFRVLYERLYYTDDDGNQVYAGPGRILAARYGGAVGEHTAVYFETEEGHGGYFRPDGTSMERHFLLAPLSHSRITSRYTSARYHPILHITRPHYGIDYAAKRGSPVWSVADGEVIYRGWAGGFGNLVKVRHVDGYVSYYAHLQGFANKLRVGSRVQQKQVIGYVGSTGLATGPHVCFRIAKNGRYVNPARVQSPAAKPIPAEARERFAAVRDSLLSKLNSSPVVATEEAL